MKNTDLNNKIEQTLQSIEGIKRAQANPFLLTRVMEGMKKPVPRFLKPIVIWQVAASMAVVLGLNIAIEFYTYKKTTNSQKAADSGYFTNHVYTYE